MWKSFKFLLLGTIWWWRQEKGREEASNNHRPSNWKEDYGPKKETTFIFAWKNHPFDKGTVTLQVRFGNLMYVHVHCMYVCMYVCTVCMYVCMYVRTYVCMHVCMYVCICMYVVSTYISLCDVYIHT